MRAELVFHQYDTDRSGTISFDEYARFLSTTTRGSVDEKLKMFFQVYDADQSGSMSEEEMERMALTVFHMSSTATRDAEEMGMTPEDFAGILSFQMDADRDGEISLEEFVDACKNDPLVYKMLDSSGDSISVKSMVLTNEEEEEEEGEQGKRGQGGASLGAGQPATPLSPEFSDLRTDEGDGGIYGLKSRHAELLAERARIMAEAEEEEEAARRIEEAKAAKSNRQSGAAQAMAAAAAEAEARAAKQAADEAAAKAQQEAQRRKDEAVRVAKERAERTAAEQAARKRRMEEEAERRAKEEAEFSATQEKIRRRREAKEAEERNAMELARLVEQAKDNYDLAEYHKGVGKCCMI